MSYTACERALAESPWQPACTLATELWCPRRKGHEWFAMANSRWPMSGEFSASIGGSFLFVRWAVRHSADRSQRNFRRNMCPRPLSRGQTDLPGRIREDRRDRGFEPAPRLAEGADS